MAHYAALTFVQRNWSALLLTSVINLLALAVNASISLGLAVALETANMPAAAAHVFAWSTLFVPLLLCVAGLTVAPRAWRRFRPMTEVRRGVIGSLSRHIAKLSSGESDGGSADHRPGVVILHRLRTAIRRATGVEPLPSSPTP